MPEIETVVKPKSSAGRKPLMDGEVMRKTSFQFSQAELDHIDSMIEYTADGESTGRARALRRIVNEHREFSKKKR